jgi:hypothetical protein
MVLKQTNSVVFVRKRTIPTERPPHPGEVSATFTDRECRVVSATNPHGRSLGFLDRSRYFSIQVAPQLYSRSWVIHYFSENLVMEKDGLVITFWHVISCSHIDLS